MIILTTFIILAGFISSIIFHEIGHILIYYFNTEKMPNVRIGRKEIIVILKQDISKQEYLGVLIGGIVAGLIPLTYVADVLDMNISFIPIIILYLFGCKHDIVEIIKTIWGLRNERKGKIKKTSSTKNIDTEQGNRTKNKITTTRKTKTKTKDNRRNKIARTRDRNG